MKELDRAYEHCRLVTKREAKNFYYAFITLPQNKRKAIYASYAFCRLCDDAADDEIPTDQKLRALGELRDNLSMAYRGHFAGPVREPVFAAVADTASTFQIPEEYYQGVVSGVETDLTKSRYQDFQELTSYCYQVASVVGLFCIQIFGYSHEQAKQHAVDLGLAMQLTNILRDVKEDSDRGRVYLPQEEIRDFGYSVEELQSGIVNEPFQQLMKYQADRARSYFHSGFQLLPYLSPRARACPAVLGRLYSHILDRIEARDFNVFAERISLTRREKYLVTALTWMRSLLPMPVKAQ